MAPIEYHLKKVDEEIKDGRIAADAQLYQLLDAESTHKFKRKSLEDLSQNIKSAIFDVAEKKKRAIEEDAAKLVQEVDRFMEDFKGVSGMLTEMTKCEKTSFDIWKNIYSAMSKESGDTEDDYLLDFHEFLRANDDVAKGRNEVVTLISGEVERLLQMFIEFKENEEAVPGNQVGSIDHQVTPAGSQPASDSGKILPVHFGDVT
jgi:hypothetical protein